VGFDAEVSTRSRAAGGGAWTYLRETLAALRSNRPVPVSVVRDGAPPWRGAVWAVVVANGRCYGGGMRIAPAADPEDGRLDVVVLGALSRPAFLAWLPTVYAGWHVHHPRVHTARAVEVEVRAEVPLPIHTDGEPAGFTPARLVVQPGALRLLR
jgi:diacylglycerol kinase family enzyme